jgi:hypothetical protein
MEQEYPSNAIETKILIKEFERLELSDTGEYVRCLVTWADVIRKSFFEGAIDELISTRRLVHIAQAFSMFNDKMKAIELCVSRFDTETKATFLDLYTKIDAEVAAGTETQASEDVQTGEFSEPDGAEEPF